MSDLSPLNFLLKASSKSVVEKCLTIVFTSRLEASTDCALFLQSTLSIESTNEAEQLRVALLECIQIAMASGNLEDLAELFQEKGGNVNPKLKSLVGQVISGKLEQWREAAAFSRVSLPRLVDIDWTIHLQKASSEVSRMQVPVALIQLEVEEQPSSVTSMASTKKVDFELSKEALETMLDGFGKIRDQLSAMG